MRFWTICAVGVLLASAAGARADLLGHGGFVKGVAISADGRHALTASFDYSVMYWNLPDGGRVGRFDGHEGGVGLTLRGYTMLRAWLEATLSMMRECPCELSCPSCTQDQNCGNGNEPLDKRSAMLILDEWLTP